MGRSTLIMLAALTLLACAACNAGKPAPEKARKKQVAEDVGPPEPGEAANKVPAEGALVPARVTLEEPGSHFALWRYAPEQKARTIEVTMRSALGLEMGGTKLPKQVMPPLRSTFDTVVNKEGEAYILGFKSATLEVIDDPYANQEVATALRHTIAGVDDLEGTVRVDERGLASHASFKLSKASSEQLAQTMEAMRQSLTRLVVPMPEEAVGKGGRWTATVEDHWLGATVEQITTYTVLSVDDDGLIGLAIELEMKAAPQDFDFPLAPEGQTIRLVSLVGKGTGHAKVRLNRLLPVELMTAMNTELALSVSDERGQTQESTFEVELGLEIVDRAEPEKLEEGAGETAAAPTEGAASETAAAPSPEAPEQSPP